MTATLSPGGASRAFVNGASTGALVNGPATLEGRTLGGEWALAPFSLYCRARLLVPEKSLGGLLRVRSTSGKPVKVAVL